MCLNELDESDSITDVEMELFQSNTAWINLDAVSKECTLGKGMYYFYVENNRPVDEVNHIFLY